MAQQSFSNFSGNQNGNPNEPTSYVAADGFVGAPSYPFNPNSPTFGPATFPAGVIIPNGIVTQTLPLAVTAVTNTDLTMTIPAGATITSIHIYTTTAFTGNTNGVTLQIGSAVGGAQYVAAVNISAIGVISATLVGSAAAALLSIPNASPNLFIRLVQAASSTAIGAGALVVSYTLP